MLQNYLKIAWRNLYRNKMYSLINIGGLAVGMAVAMIIGLWVNDEVSYNRSHELRTSKYPCLHPLLRRVYQSLPQVQCERASDHDTVAKRSNRPDDHRCLCHESLADTCNRKTFFPEILIPKVGQHLADLRSFKFNRM